MDSTKNMDEELIFEPLTQATYAPSSEKEIDFSEDLALEKELKRIPDKLAFKIGEVAKLLDVKTYVLRYWETEFDQLKPKKSGNGQRMYERKDVEKLMLIKKLLYQDRFSIEGARSALKKTKKRAARAKELKSLARSFEEIKEDFSDLIEQIQSLKNKVQTGHF